MKLNKAQKKRYAVMGCSFAGFIALWFLVVYATGIARYMRTDMVFDGKYPTRLIVVSSIVLFLEIAFIIVCRVKKTEDVLRGYFLFKFLGCIMLVISLFMWLAGADWQGSFFGYMYNVLTVTLKPVSALIAPLVGVSEFWRKALLHALLSYASGAAYMGIKKQKKFEEEVLERREMEAQSLKNAENH